MSNLPEKSIWLALDALGLDKDDLALQQQMEILADALVIYAERNEKYHDNWKRMGWRGTLVRLRERAERLWDNYWNADDLDFLEEKMYVPRDVDDALDLINFAAFFIRGMNGRETTRDGNWWS
jgi:hypothetical protein